MQRRFDEIAQLDGLPEPCPAFTGLVQDACGQGAPSGPPRLPVAAGTDSSGQGAASLSSKRPLARRRSADRCAGKPSEAPRSRAKART